MTRPTHRSLYWLLLVPTLLLSFFSCRSPEGEPYTNHLPEQAHQEWASYLGDIHSTQYSSLSRIHRENVNQLEIAWTWSSGDAIEGRTELQTNPLIVEGVLYGLTPQLKAMALNAATGEELWRFDPFEGEEPQPRGRQRGLLHWESDNGNDRRLFYVAGGRLHALDPGTGDPVVDFGENGSINYAVGLDRDGLDLSVTASTPGVIYKDLLIQGSTVYNRAPGHIRAFDVRSGELVWTFRTIPQPGEEGYETWPEEAWTHVGNANSWSGMSLDAERGIVYVPTASPGHDFWGGDRPGENLYSSSLLALDAATGERIWHYQFVRHDIWDRDLPAPPNLVTVTRNGREIPAVAQVTKSGHVFLFDRRDGTPLFPMQEMDVPKSDLPGEWTPESQPVPLLPEPFARQSFTEPMLNHLDPETHPALLERFREIRSGHPWEPPSREGTLIFPGFDGGAEWGGAAVDPDAGILYVNSNEMPWILTMVPTETEGETDRVPGRRIYTTNCATCHGLNLEPAGNADFPSLNNLSERMTEDHVHEIVQDGQGVMPPFGHLSEEERDQLVGWLLGQDSGEVDDETRDLSTRPSVPFTHTGYNRFLDENGYPAVNPPWGTLNAIDLNSGEYLWRVPLGEFDELTERGLPVTGTENYGGPVATAGGLLFIAASQDEKFRAFDRETGEILWETDLPAGGYATPAVFDIDGVQYVVIAAGGGKMGTPSGDTWVAFKLSDSAQ
ncbi:MAG: PQQ-binding-like beta-propeller repeat protein [Balneolaceae bacterium]